MFKSLNTFLSIPLVRNTLKLSSSSTLMMFLPLVVTPILSRLYTPEDYGEWGIFSSTFYIINSFLFLSYENAIVRSESDRELPFNVVLSLVVSLLIVFLTFVIIEIGRFFEIPFFCEFPCLDLLLFLLITTAGVTICSNVANYQKKYWTMSAAGVLSGGSQAILRICFGVYPLVLFGLIWGNVIAQAITLVFFLISLKSLWGKRFWGTINLGTLSQVALKYKKFPLYDAPARLIEFSIGNLFVIFLSLYWDKGEIGCISMVVQFVLLPIAVIGSAMGNVFYKDISEKAQNLSMVRQSTIRALKITFFMSVTPILFLSLGGDWLFAKFLGERWDNVGNIALCLSLSSVPIILSEPLLPVFKSFDRQEIRFKINIYSFFLSLGILLATAYLWRNLYVSIISYSVSNTILRFFLFKEILQITEVKVLDINKYFYLVFFTCYALLFVRLFNILV